MPRVLHAVALSSAVLCAAIAGCVVTTSDGGSGGGGHKTSSNDASSTSAEQSSGTGGAGGAGATTGSTNPIGVGGAGGGTVLTCDPVPDDACQTCLRTTCCAQIEACDGDCQTAYNDYWDCRYDGNGETGFSSLYCKASVGADVNLAAGALIDCATSQCSVTECGLGAEELPTWENFAKKFVEDNCAGCHVPQFVAPTNQILSIFNSDDTWADWDAQGNFGAPTPPDGTTPDPEGNPDWESFMEYDAVVNKAGIVWCGVHPDVLPSECKTISDDVLPADFFSPGGMDKPGKFPPKGNGTDHFGSPNPCWFADDASPALSEGKPVTGTCPQPTHFERARMASWVFGGTPQQ